MPSRLYQRPLRTPPADKLIDQLVPKPAGKAKSDDGAPLSPSTDLDPQGRDR